MAHYKKIEILKTEKKFSQSMNYRKSILLKWIILTVMVMFILPLLVAKLSSECSGMALCMMLFLVVNPLYSIILGFISGRDIRNLWNLPIISAVAFLAGVWMFFDITEPWFIAYAGVYLCISLITMFIANYLKRNNRL